jgi:hypothetical protein
MGNMDILLTFTGFQDPYAIGLVGQDEDRLKRLQEFDPTTSPFRLLGEREVS